MLSDSPLKEKKLLCPTIQHSRFHLHHQTTRLSRATRHHRGILKRSQRLRSPTRRMLDRRSCMAAHRPVV